MPPISAEKISPFPTPCSEMMTCKKICMLSSDNMAPRKKIVQARKKHVKDTMYHKYLINEISTAQGVMGTTSQQMASNADTFRHSGNMRKRYHERPVGLIGRVGKIFLQDYTDNRKLYRTAQAAERDAILAMARSVSSGY